MLNLVQQMGDTLGHTPRRTGSEFWFTQLRATKVIVAPAELVTR